jgi:amino acid permease
MATEATTAASSIGMLAREMPSAGSLATYAARGLHPSIGFLVAWGYVLVGRRVVEVGLMHLDSPAEPEAPGAAG